MNFQKCTATTKNMMASCGILFWFLFLTLVNGIPTTIVQDNQQVMDQEQFYKKIHTDISKIRGAMLAQKAHGLLPSTTDLSIHVHKRQLFISTIRVRLHFSCRSTGRQFRDLEWSVSWHAQGDYEIFDFHKKLNIQSFPYKSRDERHFPFRYLGSFLGFQDYEDHARGLCCVRSFIGWFSGIVHDGGIHIAFIDNDPTGELQPTIFDTCSRRVRVQNTCSVITRERPCTFHSAEVTFPEL